MQHPNASPMNPLPWIVWALTLPVVAMEIVLALGERGILGGVAGAGWRIQAMERFAYIPDLTRFVVGNGIFPAEAAMRFVSYIFVHGSFTHALFAVVLLLALGKMVGEIFRWWAVLVVFFGAAIIGAAAYTLVPWVRMPLIGAYPGTYGLIGAFTFLLWVRLAGTGSNQYRAFTMIGMLLGIQLLFGLVFGGGVEWVADLAGFATGFLLSFVVSPGGWSATMARIRNR